MNDIFSGKRFMSYAKHHYTERWRTSGLFVAAVTIIITLICFLLFRSKGGHKLESYDILNLQLFITIIILGAISFIVAMSIGQFYTKKSREIAHMLPVSDLERYLLAITNSLLYTIIFYSLAYVIVWIVGNLFGQQIDIVKTFLESYQSVPKLMVGIVWIFFIIIASLFSITLNLKTKLMGFILTFATIIIIIVIGFYIPSLFGIKNVSITPESILYTNIKPFVKNDDGYLIYYLSRIPYHMKGYVDFAFSAITLITFGFVSYHKFKERQLK